ncbi:MAG: DsrE family protein [Anaerolineales bacterium]
MTDQTTSQTVIIINKAGMGDAPPDLQSKLITVFMTLLIEGDDPLPSAICLYTEGVKLAAQDSPILAQLTELQTRGVHIIICGTCLDYYDLRDQIGVGVVGGMHDIMEALWRADKVITL